MLTTRYTYNDSVFVFELVSFSYGEDAPDHVRPVAAMVWWWMGVAVALGGGWLGLLVIVGQWLLMAVGGVGADRW